MTGPAEVIFYLGLSLAGPVDQPKIDSLKNVLQKPIHDTSKVYVLNEIAQFYIFNRPGEAAKYLDEAFKLSQYIAHKRSQAVTYRNIGLLAYGVDDFDKAMENSMMALVIDEYLKDKQGEAKDLNNIGNIYYYYGNLDNAMQQYTKALQIEESFGNKKGMAVCYNNIGIVYAEQGFYDEALSYFNRALALDQSINELDGMSKDYSNIGLIHHYQGNYEKALKYYVDGLKLDEETGDLRGQAKNYNNIGMLFQEQDNFKKAIEYFEKALRIEVETGNKGGEAKSYGNLGSVYYQLENYDKALEYYQTALNINSQTGNIRSMAIDYTNLGVLYASKKDYKKALEFYNKALDYNVKTNNTAAQALIYTELAEIYRTEENYEMAEKCLHEAQMIAISLGVKPKELKTYFTFADLYQSKGDYEKALEYTNRYIVLKDSLFNVQKSEQLFKIQTVYETEKKERENLILRKENELKQLAIEKQYVVERQIRLENERKVREILLLKRENELKEKTIENQKLVAQQAKLEKEKQTQLLEIQKQRNNILGIENELNKQKAERQYTITLATIGALISMFVILFLSYRVSRQRKKANQLLREKNEEIMQQKEEILAIAENLKVANHEISAQKDLVAQKNEDITASINYAFRIQSALLPFQSAINTAFKENFILFKPRDIVSGDFYWYENLKTQPHLHFIAAADCTGHGVPGAFMSMLGISGLNEALYQKHAESPELILNQLHLFIRNSLKQSETQNRDGMDIALCCYDEKNKTMHYAGAMNPLYFTCKNKETGLLELNEIKADKYPIGGVQAEAERNFTLHSIKVDTPTSFYLFSDGFQDQFGGPRGKKFMVSNFKKLILENSSQPMSKQSEKFESALENWMNEGIEHQIDDVLVMGIKINP